MPGSITMAGRYSQTYGFNSFQACATFADNAAETRQGEEISCFAPTGVSLKMKCTTGNGCKPR